MPNWEFDALLLTVFVEQSFLCEVCEAPKLQYNDFVVDKYSLQQDDEANQLDQAVNRQGFQILSVDRYCQEVYPHCDVPDLVCYSSLGCTSIFCYIDSIDVNHQSKPSYHQTLHNQIWVRSVVLKYKSRVFNIVSRAYIRIVAFDLLKYRE